MDLPSLLLKLKPLVRQPDESWDEIVQLLELHQDLAEYEVARYYVGQALEPTILPKLSSLDPRERRRGVDAVRQIFSRAAAGKVLRHLVKDRDHTVRAHARAAAASLGIDDVALRDTRFGLSRRSPLAGVGGFNPKGWNFGTHRPWNRAMRQAPAKERRKLPKLKSPDDLARLVGAESAEELVRFTRPGHGHGAPYVEFTIPKASGGTRTISAPRPKLRAIQRALLDELLAKLPVHDAAHGFVPGRSTLTNARPHVGARIVVKLDLKDFFPSIHYRRVLGLLRHYGYDEPVAALIAALTTHRPVLEDGTVV